MRLLKYISFLWLLCLMLSSAAIGQLPDAPVLTIEANSPEFQMGKYDLTEFVSILPVQKENTLSIDSVSSTTYDERFISHSTELLYKSDPSISNYWIRLIVSNPSGSDLHWLSSMSFSTHTQVFSMNPDSTFTSWKSGLWVPMEDRYPHVATDEVPYLPIHIKRDTTQVFYWQVEPGPRLSDYKALDDLTISLVSPRYATSHDKGINFLNSLIVGLILGIGLYYLVIYFVTKDRVHLYFFIWSLGNALTIMHFKGYTLIYLWPNFPVWDYIGLARPLPLLVIFPLILFTRRYLNTRYWITFWHYALVGFMILAGIIIVFWWTVFLPNPELYKRWGPLANNISNLYGIVMFLVLIFVSVLALRKGCKPARTYLIATSLFMLGGIMQLFLGLEMIHLPRLLYAVDIPAAALSVLFAIGLARNLKNLTDKRLSAERERFAAQQTLNTELTEVNEAFGKFVPHEFLRSLGCESVLDIKLGDSVAKEVSVLFSDIRAYTTLSEQMTPKENFRFLNGYLGRVGPKIQENHGFVNQYYGDGIMAIFMESPDHGLQAAIDMQKALAEYNISRIQKSRVPIRIGIGLHSGPLMMGVIGDKLRMDAGVVADTVNTASRMEGLTKFYDALILLSESSLLKLNDPTQFHYRFLGRVLVKGRNTPIDVFDCYDGDAPAIFEQKKKTQLLFETALMEYFNKNFQKAAIGFKEVLAIFPDDKPTRHYLNQVEILLRDGVSEDWTGVEVMMAK